MRISDWSSDVCSSDLFERVGVHRVEHRPHLGQRGGVIARIIGLRAEQLERRAIADQRVAAEIGNASCRERGCQYVSTSVGAVSVQIKKYMHPGKQLQ